MAVLDTRDVGAQESATLFDVSLRELLRFADGADAVTDEHGQLALV